MGMDTLKGFWRGTKPIHTVHLHTAQVHPCSTLRSLCPVPDPSIYWAVTVSDNKESFA